MSAIAAANITYTIQQQTVTNFSKKRVIATIAFGDGALTYPSGGVVIAGGSLGLPNTIEMLDVMDNGSQGYAVHWDSVHSAVRLYQSPAHNHSIFLKNAAIADAAGNRVNAAASNLLGSNTGSNITIAGSDGATTGGIVNVNAGVLTEISTSATPQVTLQVEVQGW